jgi:hypothetical protein
LDSNEEQYEIETRLSQMKITSESKKVNGSGSGNWGIYGYNTSRI